MSMSTVSSSLCKEAKRRKGSKISSGEEEGESQEGRDAQRVGLGPKDPSHWVGYGLTRTPLSLLTKHAHSGDSRRSTETSLCQCPHSLQTAWEERRYQLSLGVGCASSPFAGRVWHCDVESFRTDNPSISEKGVTPIASSWF